MNTAWASLIDADTVAAVALAMRPRPFPRARQLAVRKRVMAHARAWTPAHVVRVHASSAVRADAVVRADAGEWRTVLPGVHLKPLHRDDDAGSITALWRIDPGAQIPPHHHGLDEECLVLEGSVRIDEQDFGVGDFMLSARGTDHDAVRSPHGALLMIRGGDPFAGALHAG